MNRDDEHFRKIIQDHTCALETYGFSPEADLRAEDAHMTGGKGSLGISYHVKGLMDFPVEIDIPGKFSIYNSLTAIAICRHFKVSEENIIRALKAAKVKGRIEMVKVSDDFTLMIDYAHNAMALESLLTTLREYHPHRLVCLFGCGGNRAKSRRYEMGEVSGRLADLTVITSDNPRFEDPQEIIDDIKTGIAKPVENMWRSATVRKQLPMPSTMENRETLLYWPEKAMKITRRSKGKNIPWMSAF